MKRLGNKGWGIERMLILVAFLIFVLLVVVVLVYRTYWVDDIDLIDEPSTIETK